MTKTLVLDLLKNVSVSKSGVVTRLDGSIAAINSSGVYQTVWLEGRNHRLHRLVASKYLPNPSNLPQVNHKDENPSNNHVDNLEWCTAQYNVDYSLSKPITLSDGKDVLTFKSRREAARHIGGHHTYLNKVASGLHEAFKGWRIVNE